MQTVRLFQASCLSAFLCAVALAWTACSPAGEPPPDDLGGADSRRLLVGRRVDTALFEQAQVFDVQRGIFRRVAQVHVVDGRIAALGDAVVDRADVDLVVDAAGRYLIPGLMDLHVHHSAAGAFPEPEKEPLYDEADLLLYLAHGVTTVRNLAGRPGDPQLREAVRSGSVAGPHYVTSGPPLLTGGADHAVASPEEAEREVRAQHAAGYDLIKLYCCFGGERRHTLRAVYETAAELGMPVVGHVVRDETIEASLGLRTIEHLEHLPDLLDARAIGQLVEAGTFVTPTLAPFAHHRFADPSALQAFLESEPARYIATAVWRAELAEIRGGESFWSDSEGMAQIESMFRTAMEATRRLHEAGVPLLVGTDSGALFPVAPGFAVADELELLVAAGLGPADALRAATWHGARALGVEQCRGRIAPGQESDLVLLEADPLEDISAVRQISGVLRGDLWLDRAAIDEVLVRLRRR